MVFGLTQDLRLSYLNPAWFAFAESNGGGGLENWGIGAPVLDAISQPQRSYFATSWRRVLATGYSWRHSYECSSSRLFREYRMQVLPLGDQQGLLVANNLVVSGERFECDSYCLRDPADYQRDDGSVLQCFHCRRVERADGSGAWDFVVEFIDSLPDNVTGGLCVPCLRAHYPDAQFEPDASSGNA
ncbi:MAG: hypothetical protein AB8H80_22005 [Planctomycetota bacterium]